VDESPALRLSNGISTLFRDLFGRGPGRVRVFPVPGYVFVVLEDVLVDAERTLTASGQQRAVFDFRLAFEIVVKERLNLLVAECLGVHVRDSISQVLPESDVVVEVFVIGEGPSAPGSTS
jgi:uncharacterized protein YbcI